MRLLRKNERQIAGFSGVRGREVEVEKSGFCRGDVGAEAGAYDPVGLCVVDGYDEARDFVGAGKFGGVWNRGDGTGGGD